MTNKGGIGVLNFLLILMTAFRINMPVLLSGNKHIWQRHKIMSEYVVQDMQLTF